MNWTEIQKKYPKGYKKACKRYGVKDIVTILEERLLHIDNRYLYDLFDGEGIYVSIECSGGCGEYRIDYEWVDYDKGDELVKSDWMLNRKIAEEAAFLKAFEILENRENNSDKQAT